MSKEPLRRGEPNRRIEYYPRFSEEEFERRRSEVRDLMEDYNLDVLLVYSDGSFGSSKLTYLTNYQAGFPTYLAFFRDPSKESTLFVGISNHVQYMQEVSVIDDLELMLPDTPESVVDRLFEAGVDDGRIGMVGGDVRYNLDVPHTHYETFESSLDGELVDVTAPYTRLVSITSPAEQEYIREAAGILDSAMEAFEEALEPGVTEQELGDVLATACKEAGGTLGTDFISSAPMVDAELGEGVTWKHPSNRTIEEGDIVTTEISASVRGYAAQIHRPYTVGAPPTETYEEIFELSREMYDRSIEALQPGNTPQDVYEAMEPVEESGYKIYDVMSHGYGSGYRHPFVGVEDSNYWPGEIDDPFTAEWTYEPGDVIVIQPNVLTHDETKGLQFGTTVIVTEDGPEVIQEYPAEFTQV